VNTTLKVIERIEARVSKDKYLGTDELNQILREEIAALLSETNSGEDTEYTIPELPKQENGTKTPYVLMVVGVNGVGKTTTNRSTSSLGRPRRCAYGAPRHG